jgi:hypothetical protein
MLAACAEGTEATAVTVIACGAGSREMVRAAVAVPGTPAAWAGGRAF